VKKTDNFVDKHRIGEKTNDSILIALEELTGAFPNLTLENKLSSNTLNPRIKSSSVDSVSHINRKKVETISAVRCCGQRRLRGVVWAKL